LGEEEYHFKNKLAFRFSHRVIIIKNKSMEVSKKCPQCGTELADEVEICFNCGFKFNDQGVNPETAEESESIDIPVKDGDVEENLTKEEKASIME
jgi:C4-type Zn-finger protein